MGYIEILLQISLWQTQILQAVLVEFYEVFQSGLSRITKCQTELHGIPATTKALIQSEAW